MTIKSNYIWELHDFTFQSGYIQMMIYHPQYNQLLLFTFQSGYIQILIALAIATAVMSLHSNLVIFKLNTPTKLS